MLCLGCRTDPILHFNSHCLALINSGVPENATATALAQVLFFNNKRDKTEWDRVVTNEAHAEEEARQLATAAKELLRQQKQAEKEAALTKEHKKHKTKYIPIPDAKVLFDLIGLPAKYAHKQMDSGHYVELFYFTNQRLMDAQEVTAAEDDNTFVWKQGDSGSPALVKAAKRGLKTEPLPDEKLSWEQFFEATSCFIQFMKCYNWPKDRLDMFCSFFLGIQSHQWCTSTHMFSKKALLVYQAKQWHLLHLTIGTPFGFSLAEIESEVLMHTRDKLMQTTFSTEYQKIQVVSVKTMSNSSHSSSQKTG